MVVNVIKIFTENFFLGKHHMQMKLQGIIHVDLD
jgi:hypothetical protein